MRWACNSLLLVVVLLAATASPAGATNECRGIQQCIRVPGPWVVVPPKGTATYLLTCPNGRSIVGGLDAQVTSRDVRLTFEARLGSPVQPGVSTTRYALFHAVSLSKKTQLFQPLIGCVPTQGGGGRSTVSARVTPPGLSLEDRSRIVLIGPGTVKFARVTCQRKEQLVGSWHAIAFRTKKPPADFNWAQVRASHTVVGKQAVATASSTDGLSIDVHALVQVGAVCAP